MGNAARALGAAMGCFALTTGGVATYAMQAGFQAGVDSERSQRGRSSSRGSPGSSTSTQSGAMLVARLAALPHVALGGLAGEPLAAVRGWGRELARLWVGCLLCVSAGGPFAHALLTGIFFPELSTTTRAVPRTAAVQARSCLHLQTRAQLALEAGRGAVGHCV